MRALMKLDLPALACPNTPTNPDLNPIQPTALLY
jgi:hypothetical protein